MQFVYVDSVFGHLNFWESDSRWPPKIIKFGKHKNGRPNKIYKHWIKTWIVHIYNMNYLYLLFINKKTKITRF